MLFLCEVQAQDRIEGVEDPARLAAVVVAEAIDGCIVDEPIEQRGEMEDLLMGAAHGSQWVVPTEALGDNGMESRPEFERSRSTSTRSVAWRRIPTGRVR